MIDLPFKAPVEYTINATPRSCINSAAAPFEGRGYEVVRSVDGDALQAERNLATKGVMFWVFVITLMTMGLGLVSLAAVYVINKRVNIHVAPGDRRNQSHLIVRHTGGQALGDLQRWLDDQDAHSWGASSI